MIGDLLGNVLFVELEEEEGKKVTSFKTLNCFSFAHSKNITDIKWLPGYSKEEDDIFATSSSDGYLKIWNLNNPFTPIYNFASYRVSSLLFLSLLIVSYSDQSTVFAGIWEGSSLSRTPT